MNEIEKMNAKQALDMGAAQFKSELQRMAGRMPDSGSGAPGQSMGSREFALAVTNMEQAVMWAKAGIDKA